MFSVCGAQIRRGNPVLREQIEENEKTEEDNGQQADADEGGPVLSYSELPFGQRQRCDPFQVGVLEQLFPYNAEYQRLSNAKRC